MERIRRQYVDAGTGQLHLRALASDGDAVHAPLLCLPPAPSSGLYFTTVMPLLNHGRRVYAADYPGYGGSDPVSGEPTIPDYAEAMLRVAATVGAPVDVLGFHTGCLVGAEMALRDPASVRRLVLCDVPFFDADKRNALLAKMAQPLPISTELHCLAGAWAFDVESRVGSVALDRAFELFVEHLRAGADDFRAFAAAFRYDCVSRFAELDVDAVVLATRSSLREPSHAAAAAIDGARLVDVDEVTTAVFEAGAQEIARAVIAALEDGQ